MPIPSFPVELIDEFIHYVASSPGETHSKLQDLQACSLASYTWRKRTLPLLFRSLRVSFSPNLDSPASLADFLDFLASTTASGIPFCVSELTLKANDHSAQASCDIWTLCDVVNLLPRLHTLVLVDIVPNPYEIMRPPPCLSVERLNVQRTRSERNYDPYGDDDLRDLISIFVSVKHLNVNGYQLCNLNPRSPHFSFKLASLRLKDVKGCGPALQLFCPMECGTMSSLALDSLSRFDLPLVSRFLRRNSSPVTSLELGIDEVIYENHYTHRNDLHKLALSSCTGLQRLTIAFSNYTLHETVNRGEVVTNAADAWSCVEDILGTLVHPTNRSSLNHITFKLDIETPLHLMLDRHTYTVLERVQEALLVIPTLTDVVLKATSFSCDEDFSFDEASSFFQAMFPNLKDRMRYSVII